MPVSSKVSRHAVSMSATSSASRRPPGSATCPDQGSPARSARLMKRRSRPDDPGARISPTAASQASGSLTRRGDRPPRRAFTSRKIESIESIDYRNETRFTGVSNGDTGTLYIRCRSNVCLTPKRRHSSGTSLLSECWLSPLSLRPVSCSAETGRLK